MEANQIRTDQIPPDQIRTDQIRTDQHLRCLYEISKIVASFENLERTFPVFIRMAADVLPILNAVLTEKKERSTSNTIWQSPRGSQEQLVAAENYATSAFSYLIEPPSLQTVPRIPLVNQNFIVLPLVTYRRSVFGILLLHFEKQADEMDLAFADALSNLVAIAVDQYYTARDAAEVREKYVTQLELERELRESFVSVLTHDLRTPLVAVKTSAELILRAPERQDICKKSARMILRGTDRLDLMIRNLLDANRIHAGEVLPLHIQEFDLRDVLNTVLQELSAVHGDRFVLVGSNEVHGFWSREGIQRVMENLLNNAVKYGFPDKPITISLIDADPNIKIAVHNEGNPIALEDQKHLFRHYGRGVAAAKSKIRGWGLGLTLVSGMVESHGGIVRMESGPHIGTTFIVELPKDSRSFQRAGKLAAG